jgi:hypothetical protein
MSCRARVADSDVQAELAAAAPARHLEAVGDPMSKFKRLPGRTLLHAAGRPPHFLQFGINPGQIGNHVALYCPHAPHRVRQVRLYARLVLLRDEQYIEPTPKGKELTAGESPFSNRFRLQRQPDTLPSHGRHREPPQ